jgi:hypothetical protein
LTRILGDEPVYLANDDPSVAEERLDLLRARSWQLLFTLQPEDFSDRERRGNDDQTTGFCRVEHGLHRGALSGSSASHPRNAFESQYR